MKNKNKDAVIKIKDSKDSIDEGVNLLSCLDTKFVTVYGSNKTFVTVAYYNECKKFTRQ